MDGSKEDEVIINIKLLKLCRYFSLIDPNGKKIFEYNIDRLLFGIIVSIIYSLLVYSNFGFFCKVDYKISDFDFFVVLLIDLILLLTFFKICVLFYRVNNIVKLLNVTHINFLTSKLCRKNNNILLNYRDKVKMYSNTYIILAAVVYNQWILFTFLNSVFYPNENLDARTLNIINLPFPIKTRIYNQYYIFFFVLESIFAVFALYASMMVDTFLLSYGWIITFQYEIICLAFKDLGHKNNHLTSNSGNDNDHMDVNIDIKSIIFDQLNLFRKLKVFNDVSKPIILVHVAFNSSFIIILSFSFILIYSSLELYSIIDLIKVGNAVLYTYFHLYLCCKLFDCLNHERDSVNFGIYSSDWTNMDLKNKMLLLLAMQMNDTNRLQIKASPRRIINLQQFTSVMTTCYNIVSVMVNTMNKEN